MIFIVIFTVTFIVIFVLIFVMFPVMFGARHRSARGSSEEGDRPLAVIELVMFGF